MAGNVFSAGHRIRIGVLSGYYPSYLRNLNSGRDSSDRATQTIPHGPTYPSTVVLPLIRRR